MKARLFATLGPLSLDDVQNALDEGFECAVIPRGRTRKILVVKAEGGLVMEINVLDDVANQDTISDLLRRKDILPDDFRSALSEGRVKFMLCTVNEAKASSVISAIQFLVSKGLIEFETTGTIKPLSPDH